jgi:hypothetical protein
MRTITIPAFPASNSNHVNTLTNNTQRFFILSVLPVKL